jgi:hypothetical protein
MKKPAKPAGFTNFAFLGKSRECPAVHAIKRW